MAIRLSGKADPIPRRSLQARPGWPARRRALELPPLPSAGSSAVTAGVEGSEGLLTRKTFAARETGCEYSDPTVFKKWDFSSLSNKVRRIYLSPNGDWGVALLDEHAALFHPSNGKIVKKLPIGLGRDVRFHANGKHVATLSRLQGSRDASPEFQSVFDLERGGDHVDGWTVESSSGASFVRPDGRGDAPEEPVWRAPEPMETTTLAKASRSSLVVARCKEGDKRFFAVAKIGAPGFTRLQLDGVPESEMHRVDGAAIDASGTRIAVTVIRNFGDPRAWETLFFDPSGTTLGSAAGACVGFAPDGAHCFMKGSGMEPANAGKGVMAVLEFKSKQRVVERPLDHDLKHIKNIQIGHDGAIVSVEYEAQNITTKKVPWIMQAWSFGARGGLREPT